jgi:hypothetical protein
MSPPVPVSCRAPEPVEDVVDVPFGVLRVERSMPDEEAVPEGAEEQVDGVVEVEVRAQLAAVYDAGDDVGDDLATTARRSIVIASASISKSPS